MNDQARASQVTRFAIPAIAVALAAMLCLMMGAGTAWAGGGKDIAKFKGKVVTTIVHKGDPEAYGDYKGGKKVTAVKSSNKKVATVKIVDGGSYNYILITKKKAGTTKITYKLAGKTKTVTFKVYKWKNPVKTLKLGSKNYASKFKKTPSLDLYGSGSAEEQEDQGCRERGYVLLQLLRISENLTRIPMLCNKASQA